MAWGDIWTYFVEATSGAQIMVHIAAMFYVAGFLVRDQLYLRLLILFGTICYMNYYFFLQDKPLWEAFIWSAIMGSANLYIIILIILERTTFSMSDEEKLLFKAFDGLSPGEFRKLLKVTNWHESDGETLITVEDEVPDALYYVLYGGCRINKRGTAFSVERPGFIGEIAYTLNRSATANVLVPKGGKYVSWPRDKLKGLELRYPSIRVALHGTLNTDLADKVANSVGEN